MIVTPDGHLSRYFYGVDYAPRDFRLGLVEAPPTRSAAPWISFCCSAITTTPPPASTAPSAMKCCAPPAPLSSCSAASSCSSSCAGSGTAPPPVRPTPGRPGPLEPLHDNSLWATSFLSFRKPPSTNEVDALFAFLVLVAAFFTVVIFAAIFTSPCNTAAARSGSCPARPWEPAARDRLERHSLRHHHDHVRLGRRPVLPRKPPAGQRHPDLRGRQAVDVEAAAHGGQREINELHMPVGRPVKLTMTSRGRDPQLLRPRLPHQGGRGSRPLFHASGSPPPSPASITCSAPNTAAPITRA